MKTDQLIAALAANVEPVDPRVAAWRVLAGCLAGLLAAMMLMLGLFGLNVDLIAFARAPMFWVRFAFVVAIAVAAWVMLLRLARPGAAARGPALAVAVPVIVLWVLAAAVLFAVAPDDRLTIFRGVSWDRCSMNILAVSLPAIALTLWSVRHLAPTQPRLAGAAAGLLGGALGTLAYTIHCPELAAPFLAVWYVLGLAAAAAVGAALGRRLLAW